LNYCTSNEYEAWCGFFKASNSENG
jgi:hypothetical protein